MQSKYRSLEQRSDVLIVWLATLGTGAIAWMGSGTPLSGAAIVAAVLLAAASPSGALYATCASIPLVFHPIGVGSIHLGLLELGLLATALGLAIRLVYEAFSGDRSTSLDWIGPLASWFLPVALLGIGTLSTLWMPFDLHRAEALRSWRWIIAEPLIAFGLAKFVISRDGRAPLCFAIALPATVVALVACWQLIDSSSTFSVDAVHRSTATYLHPNNLALYLERAFFLVGVPALLLHTRLRWPLLVLAGVLVVGIGATFSRGALLGLAAGSAVVLLAHPIRRGWAALAGAAVVALVAFGLLANRRLTGADSSGVVATRKILWTDAGRMIRDFPVTGIGLDQFLWIHRQRYIDPRIWSERYTSHPHNILLDCWLSLGVAGVLLLVAFIASGIWVVWQVRRDRRSFDVWELAALGCLGAGLGHGLVDNGYFLPDLAVMTWLAIAIIASHSFLELRISEDSSR